MNCEKYQDLLSEFVDGSLSPEDCQTIKTHLMVCGACAESVSDLNAIVEFCREHRGEYPAVPNQRALWLRINNIIESELLISSPATVPASASWWFRLMNRSWELSFPQLATLVASTVIVVSLLSVISVRRFSFAGSSVRVSGPVLASNGVSLDDRIRQQQQVIDYWNQRVELNKARWSPQMRDTFERNMGVIDAAVNDSMLELKNNPHDEVSEEVLNSALNDKLELLKEFAEL